MVHHSQATLATTTGALAIITGTLATITGTLTTISRAIATWLLRPQKRLLRLQQVDKTPIATEALATTIGALATIPVAQSSRFYFGVCLYMVDSEGSLTIQMSICHCVTIMHLNGLW